MIIYENTLDGFLEHVEDSSIIDKIKESYEQRGLGVGNDAEVRSWRNSLREMYISLSQADLPGDAGVAVEFRIPLTSNRIDFMLSGRDDSGQGRVVLVELKQWSGDRTQAVQGGDGVVKTWVGQGLRETTHPSYQAWSYREFLRDFNKPLQDGDVAVEPCAYLHNFEPAYADVLTRGEYERYVEEAPLYLKGTGSELASFMEDEIVDGDEGKFIETLNTGERLPSKSLQDSVKDMVDGKDEFTLLDGQKVAFEVAKQQVQQAQEYDEKRVFIVEGGPGTGKTVLAINLLAEFINEGSIAQYTSKNAAPRNVYKEKLRDDMLVKEIDTLFTGAGSFVDAEPNSFDVLLADEAHRLNEESTFFGRGENQIKEIIQAAQTSVFFIDESQRVHIDDIGSNDEIRRHAEDAGASIRYYELESQFRCNGSDGYLAWLDDVLGIRETANKTGFDMDYDLQLFEDPSELHEAIKERDKEAANNARLLAGYCWEWDKQHRANPNYPDIEIGEDFALPWNLDDTDTWAIDEGSVDHIGCIHTAQGLEFDYVGVIIGPDLRMEDGELVTDFRERASTDRSVFGMKKMHRENPEQAEEIADELIKNTYRTLMSRGMKGCYIYCCDDELESYITKRIRTL
mgnify:CR=1 FL=1